MFRKIGLLKYLPVICLFTVVSEAKDISGYMMVDGIERFYIVHLPKNNDPAKRLPLVLVLHGGGGNAKHMVKFSNFNKTSDEGMFIAVYPEGYKKNWSDGRIGDKLPTGRDDVKFISMLLDTMIAEYNVDSSRIFSTGISNGGFFSIYLAYKLSHRLLAVAPLCAAIPENLKDNFKTEVPISMILINGTDDKLVPYEGGNVGFRDDGRGRCLSTDETIKIWIKNSNCSTTPIVEKLPNTNKKDECSAVKYTYPGGEDGADVILIKVTGGGHTWPGRSQYLPKFIVGNVCRDFDCNEVVWAFFKSRSVRK